MKNFTLIIIAILFAGIVNAQIVNNSFENWQTDTTVFTGFSVLPAQTFTYLDPTGWTSSNSLTAMSALGGYSLVTRSSNAVYGNYAVQVKTDTLAKVDGYQLTLPGYLLNGSYQINVASLILSGENITPISVEGAGQPIAQRLVDFKGFYQYTPVFNPNTHGNDTCLIWATLRKGEELIADAIFKSTDSTNGYQLFNVPFNYVSCDMPDTLVILISSSIPNIPSLIGGGASNLVDGSVLLVDSISYDTLSGGYVFPPVAVADFDITIKNTPVNIYVKANDMDCSKPFDSLTLAVITQPTNGTATVGTGDTFITYTPNTGFTGNDTFTYTLNDGVNTSNEAQVVVSVNTSTGITEIPQIPVLVFPVPASDELTVRFNNSGNITAKIYDMVGNVAGIFQLNGNSNILPLSNLSSGAYNLQIVNADKQVLGNTRFVVNK